MIRNWILIMIEIKKKIRNDFGLDTKQQSIELIENITSFTWMFYWISFSVFLLFKYFDSVRSWHHRETPKSSTSTQPNKLFRLLFSSREWHQNSGEEENREKVDSSWIVKREFILRFSLVICINFRADPFEDLEFLITGQRTAQNNPKRNLGGKFSSMKTHEISPPQLNLQLEVFFWSQVHSAFGI